MNLQNYLSPLFRCIFNSLDCNVDIWRVTFVLPRTGPGSVLPKWMPHPLETNLSRNERSVGPNSLRKVTFQKGQSTAQSNGIFLFRVIQCMVPTAKKYPGYLVT